MLEDEIERRRHVEQVAAKRRTLSKGGTVRDYTFPGTDGPVKLSRLFREGQGTLSIYSFLHNDLLDPLWNVLDVTRRGRGDFHPALDYPQTLERSEANERSAKKG